MNGLDHALLDAQTEAELARAAHGGCVDSRNKLLEGHLRLNWFVAGLFSDGSVMVREDLFQHGCLVALRAIKTFTPEKGRLSSYFGVVVRRAMWEIREADDFVRLDDAEDGATSPHDTMGGRNKRELEEEYQRRLDGEQEPLDRLQDLVLARFHAAEVDPRSAHALALYLGLYEASLPMSYREVGETMGISKTRAAQLYKRALTQLRAAFAATGWSTWKEVLTELYAETGEEAA